MHYHIKTHFYCQSRIYRQEPHSLFIDFPFVLYEATYTETYVRISVLNFMCLTKKSKISKYQKYQISIKISKYHDIFQNIMIFSILDVGTHPTIFNGFTCESEILHLDLRSLLMYVYKYNIANVDATPPSCSCAYAL